MTFADRLPKYEHQSENIDPDNDVLIIISKKYVKSAYILLPKGLM